MVQGELSDLSAMTLFVFSSLVPVLNPFGGAMMFLALTNGVDSQTRNRMANRIGLYSLIMLLVALYAGNVILNFFGISLGVLRVAGGIVLFSAGWQALNAPAADEQAVDVKPKSAIALSTMAFYPFTLPLTTGPGAISVTVAFGANASQTLCHMIGTVIGVALSCALVWLCYRLSDRITRSMGVAGSDAVARIFAFILICLGVATFWAGLSSLIAELPS